MRELKFLTRPVFAGMVVLIFSTVLFGASGKLPSKVYVPYEKLKDIIGGNKQGVFLPYDEFQRLWKAAQGRPAVVDKAPVKYLISTARFEGRVGGELGRMQMELTVDILTDGWVSVPIGLGDVAVEKVSFVADGNTKKPKTQNAEIPCLLRIVKGKYVLLTKGRGRRVLRVKFVRQLVSKPGLHVLEFRIPQSAISTLELTILEENVKVDITPVLTATTSQVTVGKKTVTKLQAFLGATGKVTLSWKPRSQVAADLAAVITCRQLQTIHVDEALVRYDVKFDYEIRRRGVDTFTIQLPGNFRVTGVEGTNISTWELTDATGRKIASDRTGSKPRKTLGTAVGKTLKVKLFSPARDKYTLDVKMERFLKDRSANVAISPIVTQNVLRRSGLIAILHSPRKAVELREGVGLGRVDVGQLPGKIRSGAVVYRFVTADYGGTLGISTVEPRISLDQTWGLDVSPDEMQLRGVLKYDVTRVGVFRVEMNFPEPWEVVSIEPKNLVEDYELVGKGVKRRVKILLRREKLGRFGITLTARTSRNKPTGEVNFVLPRPDAKNLKQYSGRLLLRLDRSLRAEISQLNQLKPIPLSRPVPYDKVPVSRKNIRVWNAAAMGFEFRSPDPVKPAGVKFNIAVKPVQISAVVHRLVDVMEGAVRQEAVIEYNILYAPVDTLYLKLPSRLADADIDIRGQGVKEKLRIDKLPPGQDQKSGIPVPDKDGIKWAYYKIVLQSPVIGRYRLVVSSRGSIQFGAHGQELKIDPIFAAGKISDQSGTLTIAKSDALGIVNTNFPGLTPTDPTSPTDVPYTPFRKRASLAFKYNLTAQNPNPLAGSFKVVYQEEAKIVVTMAELCIVEQTLGKNGTLNARAIFLLKTRRGDRLGFTLPRNAKVYGVLVNGKGAAVEKGSETDGRIVRLPSSAGEVARVTLEINYSLENVKPSALNAPWIEKSVPVQQTLWRVYLPDDDLVLSTDPGFAELTSGQVDEMVSNIAGNFTTKIRLKRSSEGLQLNFIRQGAGRTLKIWTIPSARFHIIIWVVVVVFGVIMLLLGGFWRCLVVLAAAFGLGVASLFTPRMIIQGISAGWFAAVLVVLMWVAHWLFHHFKVKSPPDDKSLPGDTKVARGDNINMQGVTDRQE